MFHWSGDEADCGTSHDAGHGMSDSWQLVGRAWRREIKNAQWRSRYAIRVKDCLVERSSVEGQGAEHD
jgi:hypothetical protein